MNLPTSASGHWPRPYRFTVVAEQIQNGLWKATVTVDGESLLMVAKGIRPVHRKAMKALSASLEKAWRVQ